MAPARLTLICALGVLLLAHQAAVAGGWWSSIHVSRSTVSPGEGIELEAAVSFDSVAAAEEAHHAGGYSVHLLRGFDFSVVERVMREPAPGDWWSLDGAEAIRVGPVSIGALDANLGTATAAFTVPELAPGTYHVMLCDAACAEPLTDVIPTKITVIADRAGTAEADRAEARRTAPAAPPACDERR